MRSIPIVNVLKLKWATPVGLSSQLHHLGTQNELFCTFFTNHHSLKFDNTKKIISYSHVYFSTFFMLVLT